MVLKSDCPFCCEDVDVTGAGGADIRAKAAKFTTSDAICDAVPVVLLGLFGLVIFIESSGVALNTQPGRRPLVSE